MAPLSSLESGSCGNSRQRRCSDLLELRARILRAYGPALWECAVILYPIHRAPYFARSAGGGSEIFQDCNWDRGVPIVRPPRGLEGWIIRAAAAVPRYLGITWHGRAAETIRRLSSVLYLLVKCPLYLTEQLMTAQRCRDFSVSAKCQ